MRVKKKKKRKWRMPRLVMDAAGIMLAQGIRTWMRTLDIRAAYYDRTLDPQLSIGGPRIYIFWHENILIPLSQRGHCNLTMLLSQHDDAELLSRVAEYIG